LGEYFEDSDGDAIPNYYEIIRGTNPQVKDKDILNNVKIFFLTYKTLIIGHKEPGEAFKKKAGFGSSIYSSPQKSKMDENSVLVLLDDGAYKLNNDLAIFNSLTSSNKQTVTIKNVGDKILIYIYAPTSEKLIEEINKIDINQLSLGILDQKK
jgi:hypothetical protein